MIRMHKKGISPIIAAIILIAIVVAVGALVANFIRSYVNTQKEGIDTAQVGVKCATETNLKIVEDSIGNSARCTAPLDVINFNLQNAGIAIAGLTVATVGDTGVKSFTHPTILEATPLSGGQVIAITTTTGDVGNIQKIVITPSIKVQGTEGPTVCGEAAIEIASDELSAITC